MTRLAGWLVVALVAAGVVFVAATAGQLPPTVATHFGAGGAANGWMSRGGYTVFALALTRRWWCEIHRQLSFHSLQAK